MGKTKQQYIGVRVSWGVIVQVEEVLETINLAGTIEHPMFRIADTSLSYRKISNLSDNDLLPGHSQQADRSWRKFSIKDYVYLLLIADLRSFGMSTKQIQRLKDIFYGSEGGHTTKALCAVFGRIEISLLCFANGDIFLCDSDGAALLESKERAHEPFVKINVNKHVDHVLTLADIPHNTDILETAAQRHLRSDLHAVSLKEIKTLGIIRNQDYKKITIFMKDNEPDAITTTELLDHTILSKRDLLQLLDGFKFGKVEIVKNDGRTVHVKRENSVKL